MWARSLGQEDPLEEGMAAHFSVLACRIPWTEEPGGLQTMESQSCTRLKRLSKQACTPFRTQGEQGEPVHPALELKGSPDGHRTGRVKRLKYICIVETSVFAAVFSVTTGDTEV